MMVGSKKLEEIASVMSNDEWLVILSKCPTAELFEEAYRRCANAEQKLDTIVSFLEGQ